MSREHGTQQRTEGKDKPNSSVRNEIVTIIGYILALRGATNALQVHLHL